jgi:hypothetical protein
MFNDLQPAANKTHPVTLVKMNQLMLFWETTVVFMKII